MRYIDLRFTLLYFTYLLVSKTVVYYFE